MELMHKSAKRRQSTRRLVIVGAVAVLVLGTGALLFAGGSSTATTSTTSAPVTTSTTTTTISSAKVASEQKQANAAAVAGGCPASTATPVNTLTWKTVPAMTIVKTRPYYAHFHTTVGDFVVKLEAAKAPITVNNFVFLVEHKYYDCVIFHRVIPGFVVQGGDPQGTGRGGPGYTIPDELPKLGAPTYPLYSLAMANIGRPHTGGSQFFIVTGVNGEALPPSYSLFGQVVSGQNVAKTINNEGSSTGQPPTVTQRMVSVTIASS
jgi:cyclophilin family peptidyl-prolyl cis-trans isomerase